MKTLHRYLGLVLSLIILTIAVTGTALVWKREYLWITIPDARELRLESGVEAGTIVRIESHYLQNEVKFIQFYSEGLSVHKVFLTDQRYAWHNQLGEQLQVWKGNDRLEDWLLDLHHRFLLGNKIGLNIAGFGGILLLLMIVLGLSIWWPWRRSYRANLVPNSGGVNDVRKSHFETGATISLPLMLAALTGVVLVYPSEARLVLLDGFKEPKPAITETRIVDDLPSNVSWGLALGATTQLFPGSELRWMSMPTAESPEYSLGVQESNSWNRMGESSVTFSEDMSMTLKYAKAQGKMAQVLQFAYPVHTGKFPTLYRLALSACGLLLAWLGFLGLLAFFKGRRSR